MRSGSLGIGPGRVRAKFGNVLTSRTASRGGSILFLKNFPDESPRLEPPWDSDLGALMALKFDENSRNLKVQLNRIGFEYFQSPTTCIVPAMTEMNKNELFRKHAPIELNEVGIV